MLVSGETPSAWPIPDRLYDGLLHTVPFDVGDDFSDKWGALRADGFTVALGNRAILAFKPAPDSFGAIPPPAPDARLAS